MLLLKKLLALMHSPSMKINDLQRKHQFLKVITIEFILFGLILGFVNVYLKFWTISCLLFTGSAVISLNFILIKNKLNPLFCGYILSSMTMLVIIIGNFWLGGISSSYLSWFCVVPIMAAALIGIEGLILYSLLSTLISIYFIYGRFTPIYIVPTEQIALLDSINYIFIMLVIFTTFYSLLKENKYHESLLHEQNFLLHADKTKFRYLSNHDSLTNLPNRSFFHHHLQLLIDLITTTNQSDITLYFMDLDGFKKINDIHGHEIGDLLLQQTSKRLKSCFRKNDFLARLGGDEFTAIVKHSPKDQITSKITARISKEFEDLFHIKDLKIKCTISVGMANYPKDTRNPEVLLKMADAAMYENKKNKYSTANKTS